MEHSAGHKGKKGNAIVTCNLWCFTKLFSSLSTITSNSNERNTMDF